jgi:DMSO reductase family type II enzyme heme b subunit
MRLRYLKLLPIFIFLPFIMGQAEDKGASSGKGGVTAGDAGKGKLIYEKRCVWCHGWEGKGDGPAADLIRPRPRDFTRGLFKIRTTPSGKLPLDENLFNIISKGMPGAFMPAWEGVLSEEEHRHLVAYIKTFSKKFARQTEPLPTVTIGKEIPYSEESIAKGREIFNQMECFKCHGKDGRGNGVSMPTLKDDWGNPIRSANLTKSWNFRGGNRREDIYMRFNTGLAGTPMPSFADNLDNEKSWHLTNFVKSLSQEKRPEVKEVIKAKFTESELPIDPVNPIWNSVDSYFIPLVGQVIIDPRWFRPSIDGINIKAIFNNKEIALLLEWDDPTKSPIPPTEQYPEQCSDAIYVQFPAKVNESGPHKPYFINGDPGRAAYIWHWDSISGSRELKGKGSAKVSPINHVPASFKQGSDKQFLSANAVWEEGRWRLLLKRPLLTGHKDHTQFDAGRFIPIAFNAWDGSNGEIGTKRSISTWYWLLLEPVVPPFRYYAAGITLLLTAGVELIWWRRKNGQKKD